MVSSTQTNLYPNEDIIGAESLALGAAAETLATAGATIPQEAGDVLIYVPDGDNIHWESSVTPTSTLGKAIREHQVGRVPRDRVKTAKFISDDASDVTCIIMYVKGSSRQDLAHSLANTRHQSVA